VTCRPGALQVGWLSYAPPCMPRWSGSNGGATARGVTKDTITLVFRKQKDVDQQTPEDPIIQDLQTYIDLFNKNYELYGRRVVLKVFTGQATGAGEFANQSQAQTQADAQTAYDMGSFAEISPAYGEFGSWASALAQKKIIALSIGLASQQVLDRDAPYAYPNTAWDTAENWGRATAAMACNRMRNMPAIYAGDALYRAKNRVFGLVKAESDNWGPAADTFQAESKKQCNLPIAQESSYSPDASSEAQQAVSIVTQMKAAGVTTVVTGADFLEWSFLLQAADQQQYFPEWVVWETTGAEHTAPAKNTNGLIEVGVLGPSVPKNKQESWRVYQVVKPGKTPTSQTKANSIGLDYEFYSLANFFRAVQLAGPRLTPATFQAGWFTQQQVAGPRGLFKYGPRSQSVLGDFVISRYDPSRTDEVDGKPGDFRECDNGKRYRFDELARVGTGQLACKVGG
jgi:hypothetical protein